MAVVVAAAVAMDVAVAVDVALLVFFQSLYQSRLKD